MLASKSSHSFCYTGLLKSYAVLCKIENVSFMTALTLELLRESLSLFELVLQQYRMFAHFQASSSSLRHLLSHLVRIRSLPPRAREECQLVRS